MMPIGGGIMFIAMACMQADKIEAWSLAICLVAFLTGIFFLVRSFRTLARLDLFPNQDLKTRVTITPDPPIHQRAKRTARARKTSVLGLIGTLQESAELPAKTSLVDRMIGSASQRTPAAGTDPRYDPLASKHFKE